VKLAQYSTEKGIRVGLIEEDQLTPLAFRGDMSALIESAGLIEPGTAGSIPLQEVHPAAPVTRPSKIIAVGLNYRDHAEESKGRIPQEPLIFAKFPNSLVGPRAEIKWDPAVTRKVDFEAELAVVIGNRVRNCSGTEAEAAVFGYCCANDVSARDLQFGDGQWVRGKSLDTFCPLGPWLVTRDEIPDPHALRIRSRLNGRLMQDSHTGQMIFSVTELVGFLSRHFTLFPGDLILTGTPAGVGTFREPSVYMQDGDKIEVEIEGLGLLVNTCRAQ
jgi:2-keto-4-pentenoate hydratase/2-oxohepta-3-ene-1,7-dioic acid hydratase in catechol pathway